MEEIDFSNCQRNARTYNGANGSKIGVYYNDEVYKLFISTESQLEKLNENNEYKDCILKSGDFKIPKNHLLYINW